MSSILNRKVSLATAASSAAHVFGWLENCAPESYTDEQMEEFDQLMAPWLEDYERTRSAGEK